MIKTDKDRFLEICDTLGNSIFIPKYKGGIAKWAEENVSLPDSLIDNKYVHAECPWIGPIFEAWLDPDVEIIMIDGSAQCSKSVSLICMALYSIVENPGPMLFTFHTQDSLKDFMNNKFELALKASDIMEPLLSKKRGKDMVNRKEFPGAVVMFKPANESSMRSHSVRYMICDEAAEYKDGILANVFARSKRADQRKLICASTPTVATSDAARFWDKGSEEIWNVKCLNDECEVGLFPLIMQDGKKRIFRFDKEVDEKEGTRTVSNARFECPHCGHKHFQTASNLRKMNAGGKYVSQNPKKKNRKHSVRSFRFNTFVLHNKKESDWDKLAAEWCNVVDDAKKGRTANLAEFVKLQLAEPWDPEKYLDDREIKWTPKVDFKVEKFIRVMTIDTQKDYYWVGIRDYDQTGNSDLVYAGKKSTENDLLDLQRHKEVHSSKVGIDCANDTLRVLQMCSRNGWVATRGRSGDTIKSMDANGNTTHRIIDFYDCDKKYRLKNPPRLYTFCSQPMKQILYSLRKDEDIDIRWIDNQEAVDLDDPEEYLRQMESNTYVEHMNKKYNRPEWIVKPRVEGMADHFFDVMTYNLLFAIGAGVDFSGFDKKLEEPDSK